MGLVPVHGLCMMQGSLPAATPDKTHGALGPWTRTPPGGNTYSQPGVCDSGWLDARVAALSLLALSIVLSLNRSEDLSYLAETAWETQVDTGIVVGSSSA